MLPNGILMDSIKSKMIKYTRILKLYHMLVLIRTHIEFKAKVVFCVCVHHEGLLSICRVCGWSCCITRTKSHIKINSNQDVSYLSIMFDSQQDKDATYSSCFWSISCLYC